MRFALFCRKSALFFACFRRFSVVNSYCGPPTACRHEKKAPPDRAGRALFSLCILLLYVEAEQDHISVLDDIILSLNSYKTLFTRCGQ